MWPHRYGLLFSTTKLVSYYYGVLMSNLGYIVLDAALVISVTYAMNRGYPLDALQRWRPTSSLLGPVTVCSAVGAFVIHLVGMFVALAVAKAGMDEHGAWPTGFSNSDEFWLVSPSAYKLSHLRQFNHMRIFFGKDAQENLTKV